MGPRQGAPIGIAPRPVHHLSATESQQVITYEVTATVRDDLRKRYEVYMRERHIPDVLLTGLFVGAHFSRNDDGRFRARYELADRAALERYLGTHDGRLRADFAAHFPEGVELQREIWSGLMQWPH